MKRSGKAVWFPVQALMGVFRHLKYMDLRIDKGPANCSIQVITLPGAIEP